MAFGDSAIVDNFNRADEEPVTNWTDLDNGFQLISSTVKGDTNAQNNYASWNTQYGPDCECYITCVEDPGGGGTSLWLRMDSQDVDRDVWDGYRVWVDGGASTAQISRIDNGAATALGTAATYNIAAGDRIGLEIIGSTITVYKDTGGGWASVTSETDATYSNIGYTAIGLFSNNIDWDDFGAGTIAPGGVANPWYQYAQEQ